LIPVLEEKLLGGQAVKMAMQFTGSLYPFQQKVLEWARNINAGILGLDMGLGKTIITLAIMCEKQMNRVLIVLPLPIVEQWKQAILQFTNLTANQIGVYQGRSRKPYELTRRVCLTTYDLVRMEMANPNSPLAQAHQHFDGIVFDEAHKLRNEKTLTHTQCKALSEHTTHRWLLTGTVIINEFKDVYTLCQFLQLPGLSRELFRRRRGTKSPLNPLSEGGEVIGPSSSLKGGSAPLGGTASPMAWRDRYYFRLTKEQCLQDLPTKTVHTHHLTFDETHFEDYYEIYLEVKELYKTFQETRTQVAWTNLLVKILRLRQCCNHPEATLTDPTLETEPYEGPIPIKFQRVKELIEAMPKDDRMLIYSQWTYSLQILGQYLTQLGYSYLEYNGSMEISQRNQVLRQFKGGEAPLGKPTQIMLISLTAGGIGLNLTSANHVILLDHWWNDAIEEQAIDRVHRLGQTKPVEVHHLLMEDSIEEWMWTMKEEKSKVDQAFHKSGLMETIDREKLSALLHSFI
jgi:SNF2 family DNA or RNA helicase